LHGIGIGPSLLLSPSTTAEHALLSASSAAAHHSATQRALLVSPCFMQPVIVSQPSLGAKFATDIALRSPGDRAQSRLSCRSDPRLRIGDRRLTPQNDTVNRTLIGARLESFLRAVF
jgi:hypothetical protein